MWIRARDAEEEGNKLQGQWQVAFQLSVTYYAAIMWFNEGIHGTWNDILRHQYPIVGPFLSDRGIRPADPSTVGDRWPTVMAISGWHTALVLAGLVLGNSMKRLRLSVGIICGHGIAALAFLCLFFFLQTAYDTRSYGIYKMAGDMLWPHDIPNSGRYFALIGASTMWMWLVTAMSLAGFDPIEEGLASAVVARYLPRIVGFYGLSFVFFQFGCVPLWNGIVRFSSLSPSDEAEVARLQQAGMESLTHMASVTHTLVLMLGIASCSVANRIIRNMPCTPDQRDQKREAVSNFAMLAALCVAFIGVFAQWVSFALNEKVLHVVSFAEAFVGNEAVQQATSNAWSAVHTLVLTSYAIWFAGGVLFEQAWLGSHSNVASGDTRQPQVALSARAFAAIIVLVMLPIAWRTGVVGAVAMIVLLWPQRRLPKDQMYRPTAEPDAYKKVRWEDFVKDCPKTGDTYLVIGVGFVGVCLIEKLLERGETKIRAFDIVSRNPFAGDSRVTYIQGDVTKLDNLVEACKGVQTVYSTFAAIRFWERMEFLAGLSYKVNVVGTENVIKACQQCKVKRLIQTSTSNVFAAPSLTKQDMDETSPYVTRDISHNHYSWTKACAEQAVLKANSSTLATVAIRPCSGVFGPNDRTIIERILSNRILFIAFPSDRMDWVHVENVVLGHLKAEARLKENAPNVRGEAFNIGNGAVLSYDEVAQTVYHYNRVRGYLGLPSPDKMLWVLAYIMEVIVFLTRGYVTGKALGLEVVSPASLTTAGLHFSANCEKARKYLKYTPAYTFDEAVQKSIAQYWEWQNKDKTV